MQQIGVVLQLTGRSAVADATTLQDVRTLRQPEGDMGELLDEQDPDARRRDRGDDGNEALDDDRCQSQRQLVDEHDGGLRHERLRQHDHLLLAAGERRARRLASAA